MKKLFCICLLLVMLCSMTILSGCAANYEFLGNWKIDSYEIIYNETNYYYTKEQADNLVHVDGDNLTQQELMDNAIFNYHSLMKNTKLIVNKNKTINYYPNNTDLFYVWHWSYKDGKILIKDRTSYFTYNNNQLRLFEEEDSAIIFYNFVRE